MDWFDSWALTLAVFTPVVGIVVLAFVPRSREGAIKGITLLTTLATAAVGVGILARFDYGAAEVLQFDVNKQWIEVINSRYHMAVDGISLPLLALSMLVTILCVVYS